MIIPVSAAGTTPAPTEGWTSLSAQAKTERLLRAAAEVFARDGLEAPMSAVAGAAGAGVASVYRLFPSKRDLMAALVIRRLDQIAAAAAQAQRQPGDRWTALTGMLRSLVQSQSTDDFMGEVKAAVTEHPDVVAADQRMTAALEQLLAQARTEGRLRSDVTTLDLRLLFAATRAAKRVERERWPRMLELLIDALDTRPSRPG